MRVVRACVRASCPALVALSVTMTLAGCHVPGTSAGGGAGGGQLTVGTVAGSLEGSALQGGVQQGQFRSQGLDVVVKTFSSLGLEFQALKSGGVDMVTGDYADFFYAQAVRKASLHLVADSYDAAPGVMEVLALPGSRTVAPITTPRNLEHKVVATPEPQLIPSATGSYATDIVPYSIETLATESVLDSDGVPPDSVTWRPMPTQDMIKALSSGKVNAIVATGPEIIAAEAQLGAVEVMDSCSGVAANLPLSGYFSLASYASSHGAQLKQFQTALALAQADATTGGVTSQSGNAKTAVQDAALATYGTFPTSLSLGQVQRVADLMYQSGVIGSPVSVTSMVKG